MFNDPSTPGGDNLDLDSLIGSLLLFDVLEQVPEMQTVNGPTTAVRANVAVLDGPHKGETHDDALVFPRVLQQQLRPSVSAKVLGRLGKGQPKPGKSAPWTLTAATDADKETARKYVAYTEQQKAAVEEPF